MSYDFVIVGAGSAGCLLAARLSADPRRSVLLVESGPDLRRADEAEAMRDRHPGGVLGGPEFASFRYDGIQARRAEGQEPAPYPRGRGVGGSSNVNGHAAVRGEVPDDYDIWAELGCVGWSGADVLPAFVSLERDLDFGAEPYHGDSGPLPIHRPPREEWSELDRAFATAALDLGYPWGDDVNAPGSTGVTPLAHILLENRRVSANTAFLEPVRNRANLEVRTDSRVDQILFDGPRALGVQIDREDVRASETIVAAGAIQSPALLMRSGIGPAGHLRELGIEPRRDAPVGENLLDHAILWLGVRLRDERGRTPTRFANVQVRYSSELADSGTNDMLLGSMNTPPGPESAEIHGMIGAATWQQFSRGELRLNDADPGTEPRLEMMMLSDERDLVRMRDGARRLWQIRSHPAMASIVGDVFAFVDGRPVPDLPGDPDRLDELMVSICQESAHVTGTCRMGAPGDERSVVDPECRVIGFEGLRVIDGSVFPEVPRGNTQLPTLMVAETMAPKLLG